MLRREFLKMIGRLTSLGFIGCATNHQSNGLKKIDMLEQKVPWFVNGDFYEYCKESPLKLSVCVCRDGYTPDWIAHREKDYVDDLTDEFLLRWAKRTNFYLDYLSSSVFQISITAIDRISCDFWNNTFPNIPPTTRDTAQIIVHPTIISGGGRYLGKGLIVTDPFNMQADANEQDYFDPVPIHEIFHGFFGPRHSESFESIMGSRDVIGLTADEASHLGWTYVQPIAVHPLRYRILRDTNKNGRKRCVEFYRS